MTKETGSCPTTTAHDHWAQGTGHTDAELVYPFTFTLCRHIVLGRTKARVGDEH